MLAGSHIHTGVATDASLRPHGGSISVVRFEKTRVVEVHSERQDGFKVTEMEMMAVAWAQQLYPGHDIYTDCSSTAELMGVNWISRKYNRAAHAAARRQVARNGNAVHANRGKARKLPGANGGVRHPFRGRGCAWLDDFGYVPDKVK